MSYAVYGTRIFLDGINTKPQVNQNDGFIGHRLKMVESCADIRAWSPDPAQNSEYLRETTEQASIGTIIVGAIPNRKNKENEEIEYLKQELKKYRSLKLTKEQKKILSFPISVEKKKNFDEVLIKGNWNVINSFFNQIGKLTGYRGAIINDLPSNGYTEIKKLNNYDVSNSRKLVSKNDDSRRIIDVESTTEISFSFSNESTNFYTDENKESESASEGEKNDDDDNNNNNKGYKFERKRSTSSLSNCTNYEDNNDDNDNGEDDNDDNNSNRESPSSERLSESERQHIIKTESMIIALENDSCAKAEEILQLKESNKELQEILEDRDKQIKKIEDAYEKYYNYSNHSLDEKNKEINQLKNEVLAGRKITDQLRKSLEEKKLECDNQTQQLNNLKQQTIDIAAIKSERDSLLNLYKEITKLLKNNGHPNENIADAIKNIIREQNELKNNFELNLSDKEDEMYELYKIINKLGEDNNIQNIKIENLNEELKGKLELIDRYQEQIASLTKQCLEKSEIEKSLHENVLIDGDCDQAFATYFKQSLGKIHELTNALKDAGDDVGRRKIEIKKLNKQMERYIREFKEQLYKKGKESKYYRMQYDECQSIINRQISEIENLKKVIDDLKKQLIFRMEESVHELHKEHDTLTFEIQHLKSCIHDRNMKILELERERSALLNKIDSTSTQLQEKNTQIEALKAENSRIMEKLDESKKNFEDIFGALEQLKCQIERVKTITLQEIDKKTLDTSRTIVRNHQHDNDSHQQSKNDEKNYQDTIISMLNQTENLENKIFTIKDGIKNMSSELGTVNVFSKIHSLKLLNEDNKLIVSDLDVLREEKKLTRIIEATKLIGKQKIDEFSFDEKLDNANKSEASKAVFGRRENSSQLENFEKCQDKEIISRKNCYEHQEKISDGSKQKSDRSLRELFFIKCAERLSNQKHG